MQRIILVILLSVLKFQIFAQPQVNADNTVTFRVFAPKADSVKLEGDIIMEYTKKFDFNLNKGLSMKKGEKGIWQISIGPLEPGPYLYNISIDGKSGTDPANFRIFSGQKYRKSIVTVNTIDTSGIWEMRRDNNGTIHRHLYYSPISKSQSELYVYTPYGYEKNNNKYPVLYLLHGRGEKADSWLNAGYVSQIADNLIAGNRAKPMIIVMPFGWIIPPKTPDNLVAGQLNANLEKEMFNSIISLIEESYRVYSDAGNRAIAGFSMGGAQTGYIGLNNTDKFSYIGVFSAGLPGFDKEYRWILENPGETNKRLKYLFFGAGSKDDIGPGGSSIKGQRTIDSLLTLKRIRHTFYEMPDAGHTWYAWRFYLGEKFLPYLF